MTGGMAWQIGYGASFSRIRELAGGLGRHIAHGVANGLVAVARGGKFRSGFWGGLFGSAAPVDGLGGEGAWGTVVRTVAAAVVGGTAAVLGGGKFANGARTMAFMHLFKETHTLYKDKVGYDLDAGPGGVAVGKDPISGPPVQGANNIGTQDINLNPNSMWGEGGKVSRFANQIPTVNAIAGMHDVFQVSMGGSVWRDVLNVPGMAVAAGVTHAGFVGQVLNSAPDYLYVSIQINDDDRKPRYMWVPAGGY